ncbi:GNAT family N-acetyltransferase [uncultured Tissierella sp.]|uniref:GNAT family N-acetyltransferase n=1 Tax=uncultured Tissierella sp. TaxID=448160 RepID=UPI002805584E|nr:GNAT family N-acetyltransferase [uncultured Tissierella sp.]MDU5082426.1 GNAT family N-acetyltransferase [Bacillota bacterium]
MDNIYIEKYQNTDFRDVIALLVQSFESKFCRHQKLSNNDIENILYASWHLKSDDPAYLHFVAKQNEKVVGVILIRCRKTENANKNIPIISLCRRYGVYNVIMMYTKMALLEGHKLNEGECYIEHIAVNGTCRGKGIGILLLQQGEQALLHRGYTSYTLAVAGGNPAKHLYCRFGFEDIKRTKSRLKGYFLGESQWTIMKKVYKHV